VLKHGGIFAPKAIRGGLRAAMGGFYLACGAGAKLRNIFWGVMTLSWPFMRQSLTLLFEF
jgi:hypothetical protein